MRNTIGCKKFRKNRSKPDLQQKKHTLPINEKYDPKANLRVGQVYCWPHLHPPRPNMLRIDSHLTYIFPSPLRPSPDSSKSRNSHFCPKTCEISGNFKQTSSNISEIRRFTAIEWEANMSTMEQCNFPLHILNAYLHGYSLYERSKGQKSPKNDKYNRVATPMAPVDIAIILIGFPTILDGFRN